jgi:diacylglycerol kinase (ATP)
VAPSDRGRVFVIFNPASSGGRGGRRIPHYLSLLDRHLPGFQHATSSHSGEETALAHQAVAEGYDTIVAVGGDGTWSGVANGILNLGSPGVTLGLLPSGTGNDFGRSLGIPQNDPEGAVRILADGRVIRSDVGRILEECRHEGRQDPPRAGRYFLNVVGTGIDVATVDQAKGARFLRGELLYKVAALQQLFLFKGFRVSVDDGSRPKGPFDTLMLTIANGEFFGGGFPISPGATVQDGLLHACIIGNAKPLRRLLLFDRAGKGRHVGLPEVESLTSKSFSLSFPAPPRFESDGDLYVASENRLTMEIEPAALRVIAR